MISVSLPDLDVGYKQPSRLWRKVPSQQTPWAAAVCWDCGWKLVEGIGIGIVAGNTLKG